MNLKQKFPNSSIDLTNSLVRHKYYTIRQFLDDHGDSKENIVKIARGVAEASQAIKEAESEKEAPKTLLDKLKSKLSRSKTVSDKDIILAAVKDYRSYMKETGWTRL